MSLSTLREVMKDREAWSTAAPGSGGDRAEQQQRNRGVSAPHRDKKTEVQLGGHHTHTRTPTVRVCVHAQCVCICVCVHVHPQYVCVCVCTRVPTVRACVCARMCPQCVRACVCVCEWQGSGPGPRQALPLRITWAHGQGPPGEDTACNSLQSTVDS